ncbi:hypothetical protein DBR32_14425 [Taibaiella sp. KBW10]|uniref:DUF2071 domain-containing protein n=1 Tax=Taibaiella sp. KBW10 TaxID=2153357 RepID=UPI000F59C1FA|nr:DUF2071 domain-containing protein [Taibaiella sp. KBW10]RQO29777.1 hypothetical protein DBR32_14425 [Taibaiella sp. KBW10]
MEVYKPEEILKHTLHRSFPMPNQDWVVLSEWKDVLMLHWKVGASTVKRILPKELSIDTFEGGAWVTICVASVDNFTNRFFTLIKQGFSFDQVIMQTYVIHNGKPGLYIFNQELEKSFTKNLYKKIFKLKQGETEIVRESTGEEHKFFAKNDFSGFKLGLKYRFGTDIPKTQIESWLTNRFKYFHEKQGNLYEYSVHHIEWKFKEVYLEKFKSKFMYGGLELITQPDFIHYSPGIQKLFWPKFLIK